jgi:hypothetical protein
MAGRGPKPTIKSIIARCLALKADEASAIRQYTMLSELASEHQTDIMDRDRQIELDKAAAFRKERIKLAKLLPPKHLLKMLP